MVKQDGAGQRRHLIRFPANVSCPFVGLVAMFSNFHHPSLDKSEVGLSGLSATNLVGFANFVANSNF